MQMSMTYEDLLSKIRSEFEFEGMQLRPKLSYWLPSQLSVFSVNTRPPVIITSSMSIRNFLEVRNTAVHINLLLSLEPQPAENRSVVIRSNCSLASERGKGSVPEGGGSDFLRRYGLETGGTNRSEVNNVSGVRRRLFDDDGQTDAVRFLSVASNSEASDLQRNDPLVTGVGLLPGVDDSGLIRLGDSQTPSLSASSEGYLLSAEAVEENESMSEDQAALQAVEEFEEQERLRCADKGKAIQGAEDLVYIDSGDSHTDGVVGSGSDDDQQEDSQYWIDLFDQQYPLHWPSPLLEVGEPSVPVGERLSVPAGDDVDVGAAVLTYVTQGTANEEIDLNTVAGVTPNIRPAPTDVPAIPATTQASEIDNGMPELTQREDAAPVYDDIYEVTATEGSDNDSAEGDVIYRGRVFKNKVDVQNTLAIYAIKRLFHFRQTKSDTERLIFVCVDQHCPWRVFARVVSPFSENFEIRTCTLTHTCSITARSQYGKQASAKVIAEVLKDRYANGLPGPRAVDIPDIVLQELKVSINYMKAWYAKEAAVFASRGSDERSYELLGVYMHLLQKGNPGTVYKLEYTKAANGVKQFKYLFFSLGASIAGIRTMRRAVLIDGTTIKSKFKGVLLTASMQDANMQVFPIGFGIVDSENELAWTWFLRELSLLLPDAEDLVIVSDRHRSIYAAKRHIYPLAFHGACAVHLVRNVRSNCHGTGVAGLVAKAARAFNVGDFEEWFKEIVKRDHKCAAYLDVIPREHWTQAYCPAKKYNIMSSNITEALNGALAKIVELPILSIVESIRTKLMEWFCLRREKGKRLSVFPDPITPNVNKLLLRYQADSADMPVKPVSAMSFQVGDGKKNYYVDLEKKTCTCLLFQKLEIPCSHALAAARLRGIYVPALISSHYTLATFCEAYAEYIFPVPNQCDEVIPAVVEQTQFIQPINPNGPGRRKKKRIPSAGEFTAAKRRKSGPHKCSSCLKTGHNRATCSNVLP
ncbi:uncharacterized protein LOC110227283 isoform X2 [Arabidopsis lyrata subsp. lyrata]|nr:uncharacterized protein LOC110227283 isoform X2 [Arabidopsis lyrata subsp. lyrata]|eukprot:XP_020876702.1 uncharacterized protein LOC110227283 isoform X2 [Arabidopsis lyrata subsp. lyrata]